MMKFKDKVVNGNEEWNFDLVKNDPQKRAEYIKWFKKVQAKKYGIDENEIIVTSISSVPKKNSWEPMYWFRIFRIFKKLSFFSEI